MKSACLKTITKTKPTSLTHSHRLVLKRKIDNKNVINQEIILCDIIYNRK